MVSYLDSGLRRGLRVAHFYDRLSDRLGSLVGWLALLMVLIGAYNAIVRFLGRFMGWSLSSNAYIEMQWYLFSMVFLFGASYTMLRDRHVRVDVLYGRVTQAWRDRIDLAGTFLLMLPFTLYAIWVTVPSVRNSWVVRETSADPGGLARYPIKAALLLAFALLACPGLSEALKIMGRMRGLDEAGDADRPEDPNFAGEGV